MSTFGFVLRSCSWARAASSHPWLLEERPCLSRGTCVCTGSALQPHVTLGWQVAQGDLPRGTGSTQQRRAVGTVPHGSSRASVSLGVSGCP